MFIVHLVSEAHSLVTYIIETIEVDIHHLVSTIVSGF